MRSTTVYVVRSRGGSWVANQQTVDSSTGGIVGRDTVGYFANVIDAEYAALNRASSIDGAPESGPTAVVLT